MTRKLESNFRFLLCFRALILLDEELFKAQSIHHSSICLPGCHIPRFVPLILLSVCFFRSLAAGHHLHSPFVLLLTLLFSLFSLRRNISTCQLPPQEWCWQSAKIIKWEIFLKTSVALRLYNPWENYSLYEEHVLLLSPRWLYFHPCQFICCQQDISEKFEHISVNSDGPVRLEKTWLDVAWNVFLSITIKKETERLVSSCWETFQT